MLNANNECKNVSENVQSLPVSESNPQILYLIKPDYTWKNMHNGAT